MSHLASCFGSIKQGWNVSRRKAPFHLFILLPVFISKLRCASFRVGICSSGSNNTWSGQAGYSNKVSLGRALTLPSRHDPVINCEEEKDLHTNPEPK